MKRSLTRQAALFGLVSLICVAGASGQEIGPALGPPIIFETIVSKTPAEDWTATGGATIETTGGGGLVVTLPPGMLEESQRIAIRPTDPVSFEGLVRTISATVDASIAGAVQLRIIVQDGFGTEYKVPTGYRGLPLGEYRATIALPRFVYQDPSRGRYLRFAGFELVPVFGSGQALSVAFGAVEAMVEAVGRDTDAPEEW